MKNKKILVVFTAFFLVLLFFIGSNFYKSYEREKLGFLAQENASLFIRDYSPTIGADDAKVFLVEFLDPACETCRTFYPFVKKLLSDNPGKIKLIVRYAPFHQGSPDVVRILEAARLQGKYWETLKFLFDYQSKWVRHHKAQVDQVWEILPELKLDIERLKKDMNTPNVIKIVEQDIRDAETLGVRKTPGFFINGNPLKRFGYEQLRNAIEDELRN